MRICILQNAILRVIFSGQKVPVASLMENIPEASSVITGAIFTLPVNSTAIQFILIQLQLTTLEQAIAIFLSPNTILREMFSGQKVPVVTVMIQEEGLHWMHRGMCMFPAAPTAIR